MIHYYIDTENIGSRYIRIISGLSAGDEIVFFYTDTNQNQGISLSILDRIMRHGATVRAVHCHCGPNALDFQLVSCLGNALAKASEEESFVIVSDDNGYESVVRFWKDRGYRLSRDGSDSGSGKAAESKTDMQSRIRDQNRFVPAVLSPAIRTAETAKTDETAPAQNVPAAKSTPNTGSAQSARPKKDIRSKKDCIQVYKCRLGICKVKGEDADKVSAIILQTCSLPPRGRSLQVQNRICKAFGKKAGMEMFRKTKTVFDNVFLKGPFPSGE